MSESNPSGRPPASGHGGHGGHGGAGGHGEPELPRVDVLERGAPRDGQPQVMDRRLFMQLLVFRAKEGDPDAAAGSIGQAVQSSGVGVVVYEDVNDPRGIGLLTWSEDPAAFVKQVRPALNRIPLGGTLKIRPEMTMLGRTYSSGFESDLEFWLLNRPRETVLNEAWPWAVWYPLRRSGAFARLDGREQGAILREHGTIGRAYGAQDLAHDIRLACHGLDASDNEFVIGLVGRELYPLSHVVQSMRKTRQTAEFISQMGPFFVGRAVFRAAGR